MLKVISGLSNFDKESVQRVAIAAGQGGADLIDVACEPKLVELAVEISGLPVCVSSVVPEDFPAAIEAGASMIEIGNFDSFYIKGRFFNADEVLALTMNTRKLLPNVFLSVTVPHAMPLDKQAQLAIDLVHEGADMIQTEGAMTSQPSKAGALGLIQKAAPTLAAAFTMAENFKTLSIDIPIICASGLSAVTVPMAIASGASGVGIGSAINRLNDQLAMIAGVRRIRASISSNKPKLTESFFK